MIVMATMPCVAASVPDGNGPTSVDIGDNTIYGMLVLWCGILLPWVFFLPLATCKYITDGGRLACMAIGCVMCATCGMFGFAKLILSDAQAHDEDVYQYGAFFTIFVG